MEEMSVVAICRRIYVYVWVDGYTQIVYHIYAILNWLSNNVVLQYTY